MYSLAFYYKNKFVINSPLTEVGVSSTEINNKEMVQHLSPNHLLVIFSFPKSDSLISHKTAHKNPVENHKVSDRIHRADSILSV